MPINQYVHQAIVECESARSSVEDQEAAFALGELAQALQVISETIDQQEQQIETLRQMIENIG